MSTLKVTANGKTTVCLSCVHNGWPPATRDMSLTGSRKKRLDWKKIIERSTRNNLRKGKMTITSN